jgi:diguanylate cyclase (GGDEF)-like protein
MSVGRETAQAVGARTRREANGRRHVLVGRCAGILFLAAAVVSVPTNLLLPGEHAGWSIYFGPLISALVGAACLAAPWQRMSGIWLHLIPPFAALEIAVTVEALGEHGDVYLWHLVVTSVFVGYAFRRRAAVAAHMTVVGTAILLTPFLGPEAETAEVVRAIVAVPTLFGAAGVVAWLREGLEAREREHEHEARTDALTGLSNRRVLMEALEEATAPDARPSTLVLFDLDGFKSYNDRFGHPAGDALLQRLGERLQAAVAGRGQAFRLGGDEFCVLIGLSEQASRGAVRDCVAALSETGAGFEVAASHGVAALPEEADGPSSALSTADSRMYAVKEDRRRQPGVQARDVLVALQNERRRGSRRPPIDVVALAQATARRLGLDHEEVDVTTRAAELHDVGKAAIPEEILDKPGPLDDGEWEFIRRHTVIGERILTAAAALRPVARLVRSSHERWDGKGYPDALAGGEIPLGARIIAVCDAFDAMIRPDRPYAPPRSAEAALAELASGAGTQFDPEVVAAFVAELLKAREVPAEEAHPPRRDCSPASPPLP